jgi:hypothetical protein
VFTDIKTVKMFIIRRDAANDADLKKAVTVTLKALDQKYLDDLGSGYTTLLGTGIYSLPTTADIATGGGFTGSEGITQTADGLTINFAAGEFAKSVYFKIDGSKVDLSKQYAAAFAITNFGGFTKKVGADTILASIAIKNRWDGVYTSEGTMNDVTDTRIADVNSILADNQLTAPMQYEFRTTSAVTTTVFDNYINGEYSFWANFANVLNRYGSFSPVFTFDPATNKIVSIVNYYGQPASNGRSAQLDPSGVNAYDPGTKTIKAKWFMLQPGITGPSGTVPADNIRTRFDYTFTYIGSR